jgi:prepilin-type N-terminal cleavage/methylation domain-containing protein
MNKTNNRFLYFNTKNGFTLIETLISMTIFVFIFIAVISSRQIAQRSYQSTISNTEAIRQARKALNIITEELKYSSNMTITSNGIPSYQIPDQASSRAITLGADNCLYQQIGNNASAALTNIPLQLFSVSYNASDALRRTIHLFVRFPNSVEMQTSVRQLNASGTNN